MTPPPPPPPPPHHHGGDSIMSCPRTLIIGDGISGANEQNKLILLYVGPSLARLARPAGAPAPPETRSNSEPANVHPLADAGGWRHPLISGQEIIPHSSHILLLKRNRIQCVAKYVGTQ
ncbi:uncharacterized protein LOC108734317 [Agrilus planipennis]|uniref:Uncharacterized protein LOC108734317 n=1 Tax=Agrilus planipennis TaxID=224129 RepID=A0A1W4WBE3_AGRPL|nr:uncharacterized protein LOC108734317 [Agrilus planipennis]